MQWDVDESWDGLDLLAALGQAATLIDAHPPEAVTLNQRESSLRLSCLWQYVVSRFSVVPAQIRAGLNPRSVASQWRAHGWFDALEDKDRTWLVRQMLIEVGAAWEALSALLRRRLPDAARILAAAAVSPQTALLF